MMQNIDTQNEESEDLDTHIENLQTYAYIYIVLQKQKIALCGGLITKRIRVNVVCGRKNSILKKCSIIAYADY